MAKRILEEEEDMNDEVNKLFVGATMWRGP